MATAGVATDHLVVRALLDGGVLIKRDSGVYQLLVQPNLFGGVDLVWRGVSRPRPSSAKGRRQRRRVETHEDLFELEGALRMAFVRRRRGRRAWRRCYGQPNGEPTGS